MTYYFCPMHTEVREPQAGSCPKCGMALVADGTRFPMLKHMLSRPLHLALMIASMIAVMVVAMMVMRGAF